MDTVDRKTRSRIMAAVGQKNTGAEMTLRLVLHSLGFRYRLHDSKLPGSPDLVFPRFRAVVFVHGCYWHAHGCHRSSIPKTHKRFWEEKFAANRARDERNVKRLRADGWRVLTVWECALIGRAAETPEVVGHAVATWLVDDETNEEIPPFH